MGEVVLHNKSTVRMNGKTTTPLEKAEYLIKNGYPVPTKDVDELADLIMKKEMGSQNDDPLGSHKLPERTFNDEKIDSESNDLPSKT